MYSRWFSKLGKRVVQIRMQQMLKSRDVQQDYEPMNLKLPPSKEPSKAKQLLAILNLDEKITLLSGQDEFCIPGIERVGLKPVWTSDATLGLRGWNAPVTDFPASIAMAASWNESLLTQVGECIGSECRALGIGVLLGPGVNLARVPVAGRNFEYFGEDPLLAGKMAGAYIKGVQTHPVITTVKHFACNNSEYDRHKSNSVVDERTLRELYLPAFKCALDAGSLGVMTSYNQVNGIYASEHAYLLEGILRGEWQFDGLVISDWNSLYSTDGVLSSGVDLEMPGGKYLKREKVVDAISKGVVTEEAIDRKVLHLFTAYERAGLFDCPLADPALKVGNDKHRETALQVAQEGVVLLKNKDAALPLGPSLKLCIGGENAFRVAQGGGSSMIQWVTPPKTFASLMEDKATSLPRHWYRSASYRRNVASSDAVILVVGFNHIEESEAYDRPWEMDRATLRSIEHATKLNKRTIVVVQSGGALHLTAFADKASAILWTSYLGSATAEALYDILFGNVSPSAKLPFSIASSLLDYRSMRNYPKDYAAFSLARIQKGQGDPNIRQVSPSDYTENLMVGYRQFDSEGPDPLYCFGHGLSYAAFSYDNMMVVEQEEGNYLVSFSLANISDVSGAEVVQLYIHPLTAKIYRPKQELKGFKKVYLNAGETATIEFSVSPEDFSRWDIDTWRFVSDDGPYEIRIGSSSRDIRLHQAVKYKERKP
ncbi:MAG: glycoside hydrolase family 3 N-terminal domain-containing protein [Sphaerochaeta sp.]